MSKFFPIKRWLVVDDSPEDIEDIILAIEGLGGKVDTADNIKAAEKLLRKNIYDVCIVDCFYKGSNRWGVDFLPELRESLPGLPVIMISSSDDIDLPRKVINAGADVFCPKLKDSISFTKIVGSTALQAIAVRRLKLQEYSPAVGGELYISAHIKDMIEHSLRRREERLLICGGSGTGKTRIAQYFSGEFLKQNFGSISRSIVYHCCSSKSEEENEKALFGIAQNMMSNVSLQLSLFERAVGGVLILDDIHVLSPETQNKLKMIFDTEVISFPTNDNTVSIKQIKCVATYAAESATKIIPGLLEAYAHREFDLPMLSDPALNLSEAVKFILEKRTAHNDKEGSITFSHEVLPKILDLLSSHTLSSNFRSLHQIIENACSKAVSERRSCVYPQDIEAIGLTQKQSMPNQNATSQKTPTKNHFECLEGRHGDALLRLVSMGENFDEAKDILRKIMINVASKKHGGNKSKIASSLGISRQSLYDHEDDDA